MEQIEQFDEALKPIVRLKRYIDHIERELAHVRSERDDALAQNALLRRGLSEIAEHSHDQVAKNLANYSLKGLADD